jgi:hypothetical protein
MQHQQQQQQPGQGREQGQPGYRNIDYYEPANANNSGDMYKQRGPPPPAGSQRSLNRGCVTAYYLCSSNRSLHDAYCCTGPCLRLTVLGALRKARSTHHKTPLPMPTQLASTV